MSRPAAFNARLGSAAAVTADVVRVRETGDIMKHFDVHPLATIVPIEVTFRLK
jgi:hypothetical protein